MRQKKTGGCLKRPLRLESSSLPLSHCAPPILLLHREGQALPNDREGVHSIQSIKTCSRSRNYNVFKCSTQLSMKFILFINVKKFLQLNSIFKIGEFLHVNKKTFTFKLTFQFTWAVGHIMSRSEFSEFQKSMCKFVPRFIRRCVRDDPYLCWQNIGAGKYSTSRRLRPFSAHFQTKADMA